MNIPDYLIKRYFLNSKWREVATYDASGNLEYRGWAKSNLETSDSGWIIEKNTWNEDNQWTGSTWVDNGIWDDRATYF